MENSIKQSGRDYKSAVREDILKLERPLINHVNELPLIELIG